MPRYFVSHVRDLAAPPGDARSSFRVAWRINPHMAVGSTCLERASAQHDALTAALRAAGAELHYFPFVRDCFDCVFAKDNAILVHDERGKRALVCRPRHHQRSGEQLARAVALRSHGFAIEHSTHFLEGGDVVRVRDGLVLGHGFRSDAAAAGTLSEFARADVLAVELVDPLLYHLDTALCALDDGTVMVCTEALSPASLAALARWDRVARIIEIPRSDALAFGLNAVQVGGRVILAAGAPAAARAIAERGLSPVPVPLDQFHRAGGGAACLVSPVHVLDRSAERAA